MSFLIVRGSELVGKQRNFTLNQTGEGLNTDGSELKLLQFRNQTGNNANSDGSELEQTGVQKSP